MQVVYSGGSTPSPSPRLQRKTGYGRPMMAGYTTHIHPHFVKRSREKVTEGDTTLRDSIPAMSTSVSAVCLGLNVILPGSGTLAAGLSVLCCSHVRPRGDSKGHCILLNSGVALVQFLLTFVFLLGWIWSIMWGVTFLTVSKKYYNRREQHEKRRHSDDTRQHKSPRKHRMSHGSGSSTKCRNGNHCHRHAKDTEHDLKEQYDQHRLGISREYISDSLSTHSCSSINVGSANSLVSKQCSPTSSNGYSPIPIINDIGPDALPRPPASTLLQVPETRHTITPESILESACSKLLSESTSKISESPRSTSSRSTSPRSTSPRSTTPRNTSPRSTSPRSVSPAQSPRKMTNSNSKIHHVARSDHKITDGKRSPQRCHHLKPANITDMPFTFLTPPKEQSINLSSSIV